MRPSIQIFKSHIKRNKKLTCIVIWGIVVVALFLIWLLLLLVLLGFSPSSIVISKPLPATSFPIIKFREEMESGISSLIGKFC